MWNGAARNRAKLTFPFTFPAEGRSRSDDQFPGKSFFLLFVLSILTSLTACRGPAPAVKIGLVAPFEGRARAVGYDAIYAARLAVREKNESGGVAGRDVELVAVDDSSELDLARQAAASLVVDPAVVAVVGHWQEETTAVARTLYEDNDLPLIATGPAPFDTLDPGLLPQVLVEKYAAITPCEEMAGPYAGPTYDAFYLLFMALELAESRGHISRESVAESLEGLQYDGVTGPVFHP